MLEAGLNASVAEMVAAIEIDKWEDCQEMENDNISSNPNIIQENQPEDLVFLGSTDSAEKTTFFLSERSTKDRLNLTTENIDIKGNESMRKEVKGMQDQAVTRIWKIRMNQPQEENQLQEGRRVLQS